MKYKIEAEQALRLKKEVEVDRGKGVKISPVYLALLALRENCAFRTLVRALYPVIPTGTWGKLEHRGLKVNKLFDIVGARVEEKNDG